MKIHWNWANINMFNVYRCFIHITPHYLALDGSHPHTDHLMSRWFRHAFHVSKKKHILLYWFHPLLRSSVSAHPATLR